MKYKKIFFGFLASAILASGIGIATTNADIIKPKFNSIKAYEEIEHTKTGILNYKKDNEIKINKLNSKLSSNEEVLVTITLAKPLNEKQVTKLVNDYKLKVDHIIARAIENETGLRATMSFVPSKDKLTDKETFDDMISGHNANFKGFIEIIAYVPNENLKKLSNDNLVFLVDPSADKHLISNPKGDFMPGLFWELENNNMISE